MSDEAKMAELMERRRQEYIKGLALMLQQGMIFGYPGPEAVLKDVILEHMRISLDNIATHHEGISDDLRTNIRKTLAKDKPSPVEYAALELLIEQETTKSQSSQTEPAPQAPAAPNTDQPGYI